MNWWRKVRGFFSLKLSEWRNRCRAAPLLGSAAAASVARDPDGRWQLVRIVMPPQLRSATPAVRRKVEKPCIRWHAPGATHLIFQIARVAVWTYFRLIHDGLND